MLPENNRLKPIGGNPPDHPHWSEVGLRRVEFGQEMPMAEAGVSNDSFGATTATNLLEQRATREQVRYPPGHSDVRTTDLFKRTGKEATRGDVERIPI